MRITFLILTALLLSPSDGYAFGFDDDCEEQPFQPVTGCDGPEGPYDDFRDHLPDLPPLPTTPPAPEVPPAPPATLPPSQITTYAQGIGQLHLLTDFYLQQTLEEMSGSDVSMESVLPLLAAEAAAENTPDGAEEQSDDVEFFLLKLRILNAYNPLFTHRTAYPETFSSLLSRAIELDLQERGLERR